MAVEIQSKEIALTYNGLVIARASDFSLEINKETIDITTLDTEGWRKILGGQKSWSASTSGLVLRTVEAGKQTYDDLLMQMMDSDEPVEIKLSTTLAGDTFFFGNAVITSLSLSGSTGAVVTWSASFDGDGPLQTDTVI